jgi:modification methylase
LSSTRKGDVILDPFFGTGTTGAVAKELGRNFIGIEQSHEYIHAAQRRLDAVRSVDLSSIEVAAKREEIKIAFKELIDAGLLKTGQTLVGAKGDRVMITRDAQLQHTLLGKASIHVMAARLQRCAAFNGWDYWSAEKRNGDLVPIDEIRKYARSVRTGMKKAA